MLGKKQVKQENKSFWQSWYHRHPLSGAIEQSAAGERDGERERERKKGGRGVAIPGVQHLVAIL